jgi:hypothetical protein
MSEPDFVLNTIHTNPILARRVLEFVEMSERSLIAFEREVKHGIFRVSFTDRERALELAKEQSKYLRLATSRSECGIWIFLNIERTPISLVQFVEQNCRSKSLLRKILRMQWQKLNKLTAECHVGLEGSSL